MVCLCLPKFTYVYSCQLAVTYISVIEIIAYLPGYHITRYRVNVKYKWEVIGNFSDIFSIITLPYVNCF